jgi:DNA-binding transcriptional regulator GbsR (MarR family)
VAEQAAGAGQRTQQDQAGQAGQQTQQTQQAQEGQQAQQAPDEQALRQFIERFAAVLSQAGVPLMPARVFVALLTADAPRLTADDIAGILQVSPAAVSGAVRYLLPIGLVTRETQPGSRRYWYRTPRDVWIEVSRLQDQVMNRWSQTLRDGLELISPDSLAGQRVRDSITYFDFVQKELPMMFSRWEEYRETHRD